MGYQAYHTFLPESAILLTVPHLYRENLIQADGYGQKHAMDAYMVHQCNN